MNINNFVFNFLNKTVQNFETNLKFLSKIIFSNNFQSVNKNRFNKTFAHIDAFHVDFSDINAIRLNALHVTVNMTFNFSDNVKMKFITMMRNEMVDFLMSINFS